ncbi:MAG: ABC transporter substrate-binding protein, partial [Pseudolabrys sp.]
AFEKENPGIKIKAIYAGTYQDTLVKALTAFKSGDPPDIAVLLSTDMFTLIDEDAVTSFDGLVTTDSDKAWLKSFYPAFMENSQTGGKTWGIPFQRSTIVMFWNKDAFKAAGLNPEKAPDNWGELVADGTKLTKRDAAGNVSQWAVEIPSSGFPYWLFQGLTTANNVRLMNEAGTETYFDKPAVIEALQFWVDLSRKHKIQPAGTIEWGTTPKDFFEGKTAVMWTTTGNLTNVKKNATFPFGVAMLPAHQGRGSPTGGGNFYFFNKMTNEKRAAAFKFVKWMTTPERTADWGIATGYIAVRPDAWETPAMKKYVEDFPAAAVARDQLKYAVAELSTHDNQRVTKALNDGIQAALAGTKTPEEAMKNAQQEAARILRSSK